MLQWEGMLNNKKTPFAKPTRLDEKLHGVTHLNSLWALLAKGMEMSQYKAAHNQNGDHDGELEEGIQRGGKDLCCCQAQSLNQHHCLPVPEVGPVQTVSQGWDSLYTKPYLQSLQSSPEKQHQKCIQISIQGFENIAMTCDTSQVA